MVCAGTIGGAAMKKHLPFILIFLGLLLGATLIKSTGTTWYGPGYVRPTALSDASIQTARDQAYKANAIAFIPAGDYAIRKPLAWNDAGPTQQIIGSGMRPQWGWSNVGTVQLGTRLIAGCPTMILWRGWGASLSRMTLDGIDNSSVGIVIQPAGTSRNLIDDVQIKYFAVGLQFGYAQSDNNASDTELRRCMIESNYIGTVSRTDQSVSTMYLDCDFNGNGVAIDVSRGGGVTVLGGRAAGNDILIRTGEGGGNTGNVTIRDLRTEAGGTTRRWSQIIDAPDSPGGTVIIIEGLRIAGGPNQSFTDQQPTIRIGKNVNLTIRDSYNVRTEGTVIENNGGTMTVVNSVGFN